MSTLIRNITTLFQPLERLYTDYPIVRFYNLISAWKELNFKKFEYKSDQFWVKAFCVEPKNPGNYPVIIFNRGGSKDFSLINDVILHIKMAIYASWGYVVFATQYRGNDGGEGKDEFGGADIQDVIALKDVIDSWQNADENRIGMIGHSRGGMQTMIALEQMPYIKAVVTTAGVFDMKRNYQLRPNLKEFHSDMYNTNSSAEILKRSALSRTDNLPKKIPILLIHGTCDEHVSPLDAMELAIKLYQLKIPNRLLIIEGEKHAFHSQKAFVNDQIKNWFDKYVKNLSEVPQII
jgi:dipeptidyl aminopeptidase/acylaminoacyl peptidase